LEVEVEVESEWARSLGRRSGASKIARGRRIQRLHCAAMRPPRKRSGALRALAALSLLAVLAVLAAATLHALAQDVGGLATREPGRTALMRQREREAARAGRRYRERRAWIPLAKVSPNLRRAVLVAEDDAFFAHGGLDWNEIRASARRNWEAGRVVRGGSTITQQLAKNLWLGTSRSPVRKYEELILALRLERALSKRRIFELYLNVIEWGDGVYGAEAASRHWFRRSAADLSPDQSARLAAVIINPRRYSPVEPSRRIERRIRLITNRLRRRGGAATPAPPPSVVAPAPAGPPAAPPDLAPAPPDDSIRARLTGAGSAASLPA
jgi:monofunctional biosynthetic peptidoglycan transglycosylase